MLKTLKTKKGITLLELLAVLVILGIVSAIAIPTIGNLIENQREDAANAEWNNILIAVESYALDEQASFNQEGEFSLQDVIDANYLSNFNSEIKIHILVRRGSQVIEDPSQIMFDKDTRTISDTMNHSGVEINGFFVEGSPAPVRPDNRV